MVPAKTPTQFMGNSQCILDELSTRWDKSHPHQPLMGERASKAQEYSYELCRAMCRGLAKQKRYDRSGKACVGMMANTALMSFVQTMRRWQEPSAEPSVSLSRCSPPHQLAFCSVGNSAAG